MATTLDKPQAPNAAPPQPTAPPPVEPLLVQCASCGSPIAFDQTYCVECGAKNEPKDGWLARFKTRRYVLGGLGVLLAIGGIVGYAAAAASRHDAVKVATARVAPPPTNQGPASTPPPAAPTTPPATPTPPAVKAPPVPPAAKPTPPPASHPSTPAPAPSSTPTSTTPSTQHPAQPATPESNASKPPYAKLFSSGRSPVSAGQFDPNKQGGINPNSLSKLFDGDGSSVWKSGAYANGIGSGVGFYVDDGAPGTIHGLGLLTKTPGFDIQVYAYNGDTPPSSLSGWKLLGTQTNVGQRQKIKLDLQGQQYQLYLVWFTKMPAKGQRFEIPEVQLLP
ncbi:MAG: hypothetical protein ACJ77M_18980 [Thermoleophilaceae bacterium]